MSSSMSVQALKLGDKKLKEYVFDNLGINSEKEFEDCFPNFEIEFENERIIFDYPYDSKGILEGDFKQILEKTGLNKYPGIIKVFANGDSYTVSGDYYEYVELYDNGKGMRMYEKIADSFSGTVRIYIERSMY